MYCSKSCSRKGKSNNRVQEIPKETLIDLYWKQGFTIWEIGDSYGISGETVRRMMIKHNIQRRKSLESVKKRVDKRDLLGLTKDKLKELYEKKGLSIKMIADIYNVGTCTIHRWLIKDGIKRRTLSETAKKRTGPKNPFWRGGYEPYYGPNWFEQREKALKRDNYTCQKCGARGDDVHHIIPFRKFGLANYLKANELSNLITLCKSCHGKENGKEDCVLHIIKV
jgi:5-methylcytosine-specific restriction endonuclease McrA